MPATLQADRIEGNGSSSAALPGRKIRVLHLTSSAGFYGAEQVIVNLAGHLDPARFDCQVVSIGKKGVSSQRIIEVAREMGIDATYLPCRGRFDREAVARLVDMVNDGEIDILHCHEPKSRIFAAAASRRIDAELVATNHLWTRHGAMTTIVELLDAVALHWFDEIVAVSGQIAQDMKWLGIPAKKMRVVPNGIRLDAPGPSGDPQALREALGIPLAAPVIGTVARLNKEKSQRTLLDAAAIVLETRPDAVFLLVGDGPLRDELEARARELGISRNVVFAGYRKDARSLMRLMDVFALTSRREGTPMVLLEAMATGIPVVSTPVGGIPDVIRNGETGLLVPAGDHKKVAGTILGLLGDRKRAEALASAAKTAVEQEFSVRRMATEYEEIYRNCMRHRAPSRHTMGGAR